MKYSMLVVATCLLLEPTWGQGLLRRPLGSRLQRPVAAQSAVADKETVKVIPTAREGGATWKYIESSAPIANWGDVSFDDKDWKEGVSGFGNNSGLRRTLWNKGDLYLRKKFNVGYVPEQVESVSLTYSVDDDIEVLLNGAALFKKDGHTGGKYVSVDVTKEFKNLARESGQDNALAVKAHNMMGPCYIDVGLDITLTDAARTEKKESPSAAAAQEAACVREVALVPFGGSDWQYKMDGEVEEGWKNVDFTAAGWRVGKAPFGNCDDSVTSWTTPCICLRKRFDCPYEDADIKYLQVREKMDDIMDVWLNGSHIFHWTYHGTWDVTTVIPRRLWEGLLRRENNVMTVLARNWGGAQYANVGLLATVRESAVKELSCPTEYVPADMKLMFPKTKLADIRACSAVMTGDAVNWGRPTATLACHFKSVGDLRKTMQFQCLEINTLKCVCVELEQKGNDVWGRVLYCRSVSPCDVSGVDFDDLLCPSHRVIDNDAEVSNGSGCGYALKELTAYFEGDAAPVAVRRGLLGGGLAGGSLRARRLQRQQEAQAAAAKQQAEQAAREAERQAQAEAERVQREAERAEQRQQLLAIQEELKRVREANAAASRDDGGKVAVSCATGNQIVTSGRKEDFKAKLTGIAIIEGGRMCGYESRALKADFQSPDSSIEIPYGKAACFRVEYDFPKGYQARMWTRDRWQKGESGSSYYFGSNPSPLYKGKGVAYGFLDMLERGKTCTLKRLAIGTNAEPKLEGLSNGWDIVVTPVDIKFHGPATTQKATPKGEEKVVSNNQPQGKIVVSEKLQTCDFLLNKDFKKDAKFYLCLFSASWCGPCRREMPRIAKTYAETLKDDPDIELIHFSCDQNDEKALAWAKEHDVKFPVVKPNGGNPLDLHSRGIPHLFIVKADGTLLEEGHPMRLFTDEKLRELKGGSIENAAANGEEDGSKEHVPNESFVLTGPYGIRMTGRADCKKDAEYVLKKLVDVYLPCAVRYYGDPFGGKTPSRVFTIDVQRKDGSGKGGRARHPWGYQDGKFNIGLVKDGDRWDLAKEYYLIMAFRILTVCEEADWAGLTLYAGDFVWGDIDHDDPIPRIKEDIRKGFELARTGEKVTGLLWATRRYAPMWAALEELREKHSTLLLDYCNLKNSKYAKGELPQKISADQMVALLGEVTGVDAAAIFKKHSAAIVPSIPQGKIAVAEKLGQCDFLLNKDFKKNAKFYLCLFSASWCGPCRAEMPRIAKTYAETLKDDPDIELIHFSRDQNDEKALAWAKEHDVKFPVVKPNGGNPLDLHSRGIPHLFIVKADGTLVEEGHPMRLFTEEKLRELKEGNFAVSAKQQNGATGANTATGEHTETVDGYTWAFKVKNGEATIISEKGRGCSCAVTPKPSGTLTIPSSLGGAKVTSIGRNAFFNCHELTSVTIPKGVTSIGGSAFSQCGGLTSVRIPSSVTNLDGYSFYYCSKLKSITIPSKVTNIGSGAFNNCRGLLEFVVEDGNPAYCSLDGVLYDKELTSLIQYPCDKTGTLTIPSSVTSIGHGALFGCRRQEAIAVEEGNRAYCSVDGILYDKNRTALIRCPVGKCGTVTIPYGVRRIGGSGSWAFRECRMLTSVIIPSSVTSIESMSFLGCDKLAAVKIPASVERIGNEAFMSCGGLKAIDVEDGNGVYRSVDGILYNKDLTNLVQCPGGKTGEVTVPSSVTSIEGCAFYNCRGLTSVTMRGERPDIPRGSFGGSRGVFSASRELTAIHVPANAKSWAGMKEWQGIPLVFDAESQK